MSFGDEIDDGLGDRNEFLQQLVNQDEVIGASLDVTKLVIAEGEGALTGGQKDVFKLVLDAYVTEICPRHGYRIPWGEMYEFHVSGKCRWCERDDSRICAERCATLYSALPFFTGVAGCADARTEVSDLLCIDPVWRGKVSPPSAQFPDHRLGSRGNEVVHIRATIDGGFKEHRRAICKSRAPAPAWPAAGRLSQTPSAILRIIFLNLLD